MTKNTPSSQERNDNPSTTEKTLNSNGGNLTAVFRGPSGRQKSYHKFNPSTLKFKKYILPTFKREMD